jgi:hypothetical protein
MLLGCLQISDRRWAPSHRRERHVPTAANGSDLPPGLTAKCV